MNSLVDRMITERKANPDDNIKDLLSLMLYAKDPVTGETLDDENIRYQIITFLIAGHETTSGLLSFAIYCLLTHPEKLKKAQEEADRVLTDDTPEYKQIQQLKYTRMVLNETLRLYPTAPAFSLYAKEDTVLGGEYPISKGQPVTVLIPKLHRDQNAWGRMRKISVRNGLRILQVSLTMRISRLETDSALVLACSLLFKKRQWFSVLY